MMQRISFKAHPVISGSGISSNLAVHIDLKNFDKLFILADSNTERLCVSSLNLDYPVISISAGEQNKNLDSLGFVCEELLRLGASRKSLLINVGGGMITDLGALVASLYMRGISFVQVPTSLLAMVDAAPGGKSAIDLKNYKNIIGSFSFPELLLIDTEFLNTLPGDELLSGKAEMLKHGLIADYSHAVKIRNQYIPNEELITESVRIKLKIVELDPRESGERKLLNFGHSIGHALESLALDNKNPISHGRAVAAGMISEAYLSQKAGLSKEDMLEIVNLIREVCPFPKIENYGNANVIERMRADKKNHGSRFLLSLLKSPGQGIYDAECSEAEISEALNFYKEFYPA